MCIRSKHNIAPILSLFSAIFLLSPIANAQTSSSSSQWTGELNAQGYCEHILGMAQSERALLVAPELFTRVGIAEGALQELEGEQSAHETAPRLTLGARYSLNRLYRGNLVMELAHTECERYLVETKLRNIVTYGNIVGLDEALRARENVLNEALPTAENVATRLMERLETRRATDHELLAMQVRVRKLQAQMRKAQSDRHALSQLIEEMPRETAHELLNSYFEKDAQSELVRSKIRSAPSWDVNLAAGYDHIFGVERDLPVFAMLQFSYNLGHLWQGRANRRAEEGRKMWHEDYLDGYDVMVREMIRNLQAQLEVERAQLDETELLQSDLIMRMERLATMEGDEIQAYRDVLWFEEVELRADIAYLRTHIEHVEKFLARMGQAVPHTRSSNDLSQMPVAQVSPDPVVPEFDFERIAMTSGTIKKLSRSTFRIEDTKIRADFRNTSGKEAHIGFKYLGPTKEQSALASGAVRQQIGLKLLSQDSCNVLYVMWRLTPKAEVVVSTKNNPGQQRHAQCGARGYKNVTPEFRASPPAVTQRSEHQLHAVLNGTELEVFADGERVWKGEVPSEDLTFSGPAGIRTDNGIFDVTVVSLP